MKNIQKIVRWNLGTFILYLETEYGKGEVWEKSIYPEIKRSLRKISHSIAHHTELTPGRFEIFGCDWSKFTIYSLDIFFIHFFFTQKS